MSNHSINAINRNVKYMHFKHFLAISSKTFWHDILNICQFSGDHTVSHMASKQKTKLKINMYHFSMTQNQTLTLQWSLPVWSEFSSSIDCSALTEVSYLLCWLQGLFWLILPCGAPSLLKKKWAMMLPVGQFSLTPDTVLWQRAD